DIAFRRCEMNARRLTALAGATLFVACGFVLRVHTAPAGGSTAVSAPAVDSPLLTRAGLPEPSSAKAVLSAALLHRHPQYLDLAAGTGTVKSFVAFPERGRHAPIIVITADNQGM